MSLEGVSKPPLEPKLGVGLQIERENLEFEEIMVSNLNEPTIKGINFQSYLNSPN